MSFITYIESNYELFRFNINEEDHVTSVFKDLMLGLLCDNKNMVRSQSDNLNRPLTDEEAKSTFVAACKQTLTFVDSIPKRTNNNFSDYVRKNYLIISEKTWSILTFGKHNKNLL